jgi:hypothetical protein
MESQKADASFYDTIFNQSVEQTLERLQVIDSFLIKLKIILFPDLSSDPDILKEGRALI